MVEAVERPSGLDRWIAPWAPWQVAILTATQGRPDLHPYTCPGGRAGCDTTRKLFATTNGWVCHCSHYRQALAHAMAAPPGVDGETKGDG